MIDRAVVPGQWNSVFPQNYGFEECCGGHNFGPAIREYYLLHYIFKGEGTFWKEGRAHSVSSGDAFVICPDEVTTYTASETNPWSYCWLGFQTAGELSFLDQPVIRQAPVGYVFEQLRECCHQDDPGCRIYALTFELLWRLSQRSMVSGSHQGNYAVYARTHLENSYMTAITIEEIAKTLHIDRRHLTYVFRKTYGISPQTFLMELRMKKAREFLEKGYSVSDSAIMAGFADLSNFSKKYKAYYGICPRLQKGGGG